MRKLTAVLLVSLAMGFAITANGAGLPPEGSFYAGLKGGLDFCLNTDVTGNYVFFTGGIIVGRNFNDITALQMELNYFGKLTSYSVYVPDFMTEYETEHFLQVPVLFKIKCFSSNDFAPYVDIGPSFDSIFAVSTNFGNPDIRTYMSLSGIIGLGFDFLRYQGRAVELELRADQSLASKSSVSYYPSFVFLTLGYIF